MDPESQESVWYEPSSRCPRDLVTPPFYKERDVESRIGVVGVDCDLTEVSSPFSPRPLTAPPHVSRGGKGKGPAGLISAKALYACSTTPPVVHMRQRTQGGRGSSRDARNISIEQGKPRGPVPEGKAACCSR